MFLIIVFQIILAEVSAEEFFDKDIRTLVEY